MQHTKNKFGAITLKMATTSYISCIRELEQSELFVVTSGISIALLGRNKERARKQLIEIYGDNQNEASKELVKKLSTINIDDLFNSKVYEQSYCQMAYARAIDNLTTYFKDILAEVIIKKPKLLKSNEVEKLDFILDFSSMDSLISALSEKKVDELFYKGIDKIEEFFKLRLNIELFKSAVEKKKINRMIKNRNLIVHNRGRVNRIFLNEFPEAKLLMGQSLKFSYEDLGHLNVTIANFISHLDYEISSKFKLDIKKTIQ
jgi:hypothetical protein